MLDKIVENLESARSRIEAKFGEAGGFLQETLHRVEQQLDVLAELGKALDPQTVGSATADLRAAAEALFAVPANLEVRHTKLQALRRQGGDLRKNVSEIQGLLRYLRAFAFNVKITAAGMGAQSQQFSTFSSEMETRIDYGEKQIAQFCVSLTDLERYIDKALASEAKLSLEARSMLPAVPQGLVNDADAVDVFHARTAENAVNVRTLAQRIQKCILGALSTLQVGDNVRQRIEHVQAALASLTELDAKLAAEQVDAEQRRKLRSLVCAMLAAQLEDMSDVFATEATRMMDLMGQIAVDSHVMAETLEFGRHDGREGGLRSLEQSVAQALVLVNDMEEAARYADTLHNATSEAVQDLVERVGVLHHRHRAVLVVGDVHAGDRGVEAVRRETGDDAVERAARPVDLDPELLPDRVHQVDVGTHHRAAVDELERRVGRVGHDAERAARSDSRREPSHRCRATGRLRRVGDDVGAARAQRERAEHGDQEGLRGSRHGRSFAV